MSDISFANHKFGYKMHFQIFKNFPFKTLLHKPFCLTPDELMNFILKPVKQ